MLGTKCKAQGKPELNQFYPHKLDARKICTRSSSIVFYIFQWSLARVKSMWAKVFDCKAVHHPHDQGPRFESLAVQSLPQKVQGEAELRLPHDAGDIRLLLCFHFLQEPILWNITCKNWSAFTSVVKLLTVKKTGRIFTPDFSFNSIPVDYSIR